MATASTSGEAIILRQSSKASRAPQVRRAASALSARVVHTAVNSTSELARTAGRWDRADQVPVTLAPSRPSLILPTISHPPKPRHIASSEAMTLDDARPLAAVNRWRPANRGLV